MLHVYFLTQFSDSIEAVNADMPFDRFLLEQLAGDLLPFDSIGQRDRQRIAAGFLVVGPKVLLGVKAQKRVAQPAEEDAGRDP